MASVNKVLLIGNLGRDPEVRYSQNGECFATLSIGTTDKWKDKTTGEPRELTEWHRVIVSGKSAEYIKQFAKKGSQIYVEGQLRTRKWTDKDGIERYTTEIRYMDVQLLGSRSGGNNGNGAQGDSAGTGQQRGRSDDRGGRSSGQGGTGQRQESSRGEPGFDQDYPF